MSLLEYVCSERSNEVVVLYTSPEVRTLVDAGASKAPWDTIRRMAVDARLSEAFWSIVHTDVRSHLESEERFVVETPKNTRRL